MCSGGAAVVLVVDGVSLGDLFLPEPGGRRPEPSLYIFESGAPSRLKGFPSPWNLRVGGGSVGALASCFFILAMLSLIVANFMSGYFPAISCGKGITSM